MIECIVSSSLLIVVLILLRFLFRGKISRRLQYALWGLVLIRLLLPFQLFDSPISVMNAVDKTQIFNSVSDIQVYSDMIQNSELSPDEARAVGNGTLHEIQGYPVESGNGHLRNYIFTDSLYIVLGRILKNIWLIGAIAVGLWFVSINLLFYRKLRITRQAYSAENCKLPVYITEHVVSPCLFGIFRPAIYLTPEASEDDIRARHALAHELCHYRHGDHIWSVLRGLCLSIYWWNPLIWAAAVFSRSDSELACDEAVIRQIGEDNRFAYGNSLVEMIAVKKATSGLFYAATPMTSGKNGIKERLILITRNPKTLLPALAAVVLAMAICVGCTFTSAQKDSVKPESNTVSPEYAKELFGFRNRYIGNASADMELLNAMGVSKNLGAFKLELETNSKPYVLRIVFTDEVADIDALNSEMKRNAMLLLALIDNASEIQWKYIYTDNGAIRASTGSVTDEYANAALNGDIKNFGKSADQVKALFVRLDTLYPSAVDRTNLDACVSDAILSNNADQYLKGDFAAEAHTVFKTVENGDRTTVYAMALYTEFSYAENGALLKQAAGGHMPVAITFERNTAGEYSLVEYWIPQDGAYYGPSIIEKFPSELHDWDLLSTQRYILAHMQSCYAQAIAYGTVDTTSHLNKLLTTICSSPAVSSRPGDYIDAHPIEYRELLYYGDYTLRYVYGEFLKGGQTGLNGHIMLSVMRDLLGNEDVDIGLTATGQEWFDKWEAQALQNRSEIEKSKPKTAILFQEMDKLN